MFSSDRDGQHRITAGTGGIQPKWSQDERELFFLTGPGSLFGRVMVADVRADTGFAAGPPGSLPIEGIIYTGPRPYDVTRDGKTFLVMTNESVTDGNTPVDQILVTLNWFEELKRRVPVN